MLTLTDLNEQQNSALYGSLMLFLYNHIEEDVSDIDLYNAWTAENKMFIEDALSIKTLIEFIARTRRFGTKEEIKKIIGDVAKHNRLLPR